MKKTAIALAAALTLSGCSLFNDTKTESNTLAQVDRSMLLDSPRLNVVERASVEDAYKGEVDALRTKLLNAKDGDIIEIEAGKYRNLGQLTIEANNVTIKARKAGTAWVTGLVQFELKGNDITLDGLVFTEGGPNERFGGVRVMGDRNVLKNSTFYYFNDDYTYEPDARRSEYPKYLWVSLWGKDGQVINNRFEGKQKRGTLIGVQKDDTPDNHIIKHNIFLDQKPNQFNEFDIKEAIRYNGNSWEAIRIGDSKSSQWPSNSQFVDNLLISMDGERELISIKSGGNVIGGNTIFESSSLISLRHGKANIVEDNVILGNEKLLTGGMRIYDEDHVIRNNYIANTRGRDGLIEGNADLRGGIVINTGIIDVQNGEKLDQSVKGKELNKQWTPKNITIENNTLVDTEWGIVYGNQTHRVSLFNNKEVSNIFGGVDVHFKHNLIDNSKNPEFVAVRATKDFPLVGATYADEVYVGAVTEAELISDYSNKLPKITNVNGFETAENAGADVSKLKIITADVAGPDYVIK
ncbi:polysaccharide lyase 6 family protein [Vibrio sp. B1Z05]|uniref:polysaccharide lyase 6 family protein n=1 Tax=Vibrio sp. B1Z05 TaxID=2654980 RepID=UPI00128E068E|nr:polysaccharide lyase 6 family protein [Vibrio sp. B1Z05]MPW36399.1 alginate lyase [Vibrio sp. B1Z05]